MREQKVNINSYLFPVSTMNKIRALQSAFGEIIEQCQPFVADSAHGIPFIRENDYVGLAIEICARAEAGISWRVEAESYSELADIWTDRVDWAIDHKALGKQMSLVRANKKKDIHRRAQMILDANSVVRQTAPTME